MQEALILEALVCREQRFGMGRRQADFVVVHAGREIAAALVVGGRTPLRPARLGHTSVDRTGGVVCRCGQVGCLVAQIEAAERGLVGAAPALPATLDPAPSVALSYLGLGLIHLVNILNPAGVVLAGPLIESTPGALPWLAHAMRTAALATSRSGLLEVAAPCADPEGPC